MGLIKLPETNYDNYYDQSKFNLTWQINVFIFFANLVFLPFMYVTAKDQFIGLLSSSILALIYQLVLYRTRRYEGVAIVWVVIGVLSTATSLLFVPTLMHLGDLVFMFMVVVYAFFTLGKLAGILVTITNVLSIATYLILVLNNDKFFFDEISAVEIAKTVGITIYGMTITTFIIIRYLEHNRYAAAKYVEANQLLEEKNEIVNKRNEEKTVMLREIHHRVKNNLQVITSLLRLQSFDEDDPKTLAMFNEAIRRISAMSMIHEKIYQAEDLAKLDFHDYLISLSDDLIDSYAITQDVKISVDADPLDLSNRYFVPIALLCNELISNSLKHAFSAKLSGKIGVRLKRLEKGVFEMTYEDDGGWKEPVSEKTFGSELIEALVEQLNGTYKRNCSDTGTSYQFVLNGITES